MDVLKDDVDKLDNFRVGQKVDVLFNIRGNEYNGKHFVDLTAWSIKTATDAPQSTEDIDDGDGMY